jgi:hypothetical protein
MKTPPDLRQEASISVVSRNWEIRQAMPTCILPLSQAQNNPKSVSATKNAGLSRTAAQITAADAIGLTTPSAPVRDSPLGLTSTRPGRISLRPCG